MRRIDVLPTLVLSIILAGCSQADSGGGAGFAIDEIGYVYQNQPTEYFSSGETCALNVYAYFSGGLTTGDIASVTIRNDEGTTWSIEDSSGNFDTSCFDADYSCITASGCYRSADPHRLPLGTLTVTITLMGGKQVSKTITVEGPDQAAPGVSSYLYTENYPGPPSVGDIAAIRRPTVSAASWSGSTLNISLADLESRVDNGYLWFYDASSSYLGRTSFFYAAPSTPNSFYSPGSGTGTVAITGSGSLSFTNLSAVRYVRPVVFNGTFDSAASGWNYHHRSVGAKLAVSGTYPASVRAAASRGASQDAGADTFAPTSASRTNR